MNVRHIFAAVAIATTTLGIAGSITAAARASNGTRQLAILNRSTEAFTRATHRSKPVEYVSRRRPITGEQTVLPVITRHAGPDASTWLKVLLPGRPNSHTGWLPITATTSEITHWQITIRLSARKVTVLWNNAPRRRFAAVVGKPSTPTPHGHFFVEENVALGAHAVGAPYALALSARSNVLQEFDGGPGQIALHGTDNIGGAPGTAASHGCIRLSTPNITWLADHIAPGTPVTILR